MFNIRQKIRYWCQFLPQILNTIFKIETCDEMRGDNILSILLKKLIFSITLECYWALLNIAASAEIASH